MLHAPVHIGVCVRPSPRFDHQSRAVLAKHHWHKAFDPSSGMFYNYWGSISGEVRLLSAWSLHGFIR